MKLNIKESSWSGWSKDYKPEVKEKLYDIKLNGKYIIKTSKISYIKDGKIIEEEIEKFSFEIVEINSDNIKIKTFQPFSNNGNGTINLRSDKKEFVIYCENALELITPTTDMGDIYYLTLIK